MEMTLFFETYKNIKNYLMQNGYKNEIEFVENRTFDDMTADDFFNQYVYVLCNSGMKNQVAEQIYNKYLKYGASAINHFGKKQAIELAKVMYRIWFSSLDLRLTDEKKLEFIGGLPWIGQITKYHLARNLGIDVAKPDRHLSRLAKKLGYDNVQKMCKEISERTGDRIGTVDVVLWRASNLGLVEELINK
jgi:hypothetical protein